MGVARASHVPTLSGKHELANEEDENRVPQNLSPGWDGKSLRSMSEVVVLFVPAVVVVVVEKFVSPMEETVTLRANGLTG